MRKVAFTLTIAGIFILLFMLNFSSPLKVNNPSSLSALEDNTKVQTQGKVISERILYDTTKLIKIDNGIEILCVSCPRYVNRTLTILGITERYQNNTQVRALRITSP